ncbi:MAG: hypothetical protein RLZZ488_2646 [Pseudomonadota bacterium]
MKNAIKFSFPLLLILALIAWGSLPLIQFVTSRWFERDAEVRSKIVADAIEQSMSEAMFDTTKQGKNRRQEVLRRISQSERVFAIAICQAGTRVESTHLFPTELSCQAFLDVGSYKPLNIERATGTYNVSVAPLTFQKVSDAGSESKSDGSMSAQMILIHDMEFAQKRFKELRVLMFLVYLVLGIFIAVVTVLVSRWSYRGWIKSARDTLSQLTNSHREEETGKPSNVELEPLLSDVRSMMRDLQANRAIRDDLQLAWSAQSLKNIINDELAGSEVIVVSNRQPYIHQRFGDAVRVLFPASGLVTALEPILRACGGTWIAHGNGNEDRNFVDAQDCVMVPPDAPEYKLKRVWLTAEEEEGYYYGFSNEGLWPLCHIAHTRPIFRAIDWEQYVRANEKFAEAVIASSKSDSPIVLVQDYHLALVPRLIRRKLPNATIITFWHIPWPNPEAFGICPWREQLLDGVLGSSIVGFHTRFHRNNFLDSIDRYLESRIDRENSSIHTRGGNCLVKAYPISIEWPPNLMRFVESAEDCLESVRSKHNLSADIKIGLGVDRLDYSKGILERFRSVERFLELNPQWVGKFTFIQIAAPSRSTIAAYQSFEAEVHELARAINGRFTTAAVPPLILLAEHHEPKSVYTYMRATNLMYVSSLHDGMNLVSKEFVAAREDEQGVLLLSMFAGASRELTESLIVNPYDVDQSAAAILAALTMPAQEQRERLHAMRAHVREFNIFRWAGKMLLDAALVRRRSVFEKRFASFS